MRCQSSVNPNFGSIICVSPELCAKAVKAGTDAFLKSGYTDSRVGGDTYADVLLQAASTSGIRGFEEDAFRGRLKIAGRSLHVQTREKPVEYDGKRIAQTYITNDDLGQDEHNFDHYLEGHHGIVDKNTQADRFPEFLPGFFAEMLDGGSFNEEEGFYYLA